MSVFVFHVSLIAKVAWIQGHGLESHLTDRRGRGLNSGTPGYKVSGLSTTQCMLYCYYKCSVALLHVAVG